MLTKKSLPKSSRQLSETLEFIWSQRDATTSEYTVSTLKIFDKKTKMKNFDWTSFTKKIAIKASLTEIYNAWTKSSETEKWFLKNADFFDENKTPISKNGAVQKGGSYEWSWHLYEDVMKGEIREANGKDFIQFTFEGLSLVDVKLTEENNYVLVELTQKEIPLDDHSKQYVRLGCASGWAFYLVNLKSVYEGGLDLRNKDTSLSPMINN